MVRRPHIQTWISLKPSGQSWSNFMCSITWVGERLHKVSGQIGSKLWFPWQHVFDPIVFILAGNEDMHKISDNFEFRPVRTTDYRVSCPWTSKKFPIDIMGKCCLHASSFIFDWIIIKVAGNQERHRSSVEFVCGLNQTTQFGVTCPWVTNISHFLTWISLKPVGQSWSFLIKFYV